MMGNRLRVGDDSTRIARDDEQSAVWFDPLVRTATARRDSATRQLLEAYYDAVPRATARVEEFGSLCLFIRTSVGQPYYARPALGPAGAISLAAVRAVLDRQRELGLPQSLEWVDETTPDLTDLAGAAGLIVHRHPLMVFEMPPVAHSARPEIAARVLADDDPALATAIAAAHLAFDEPGTASGSAGRVELATKAAELAGDGWLAALAARMRAGQAVVAAAFLSEFGDSADPIAVSSGQHNPIATTTEIVGVGTLPSVRRRGYAHAVTQVLVDDALGREIDTIFLSAGDEDVARIYQRIGFRRIGTALVAEPAAS
jgi:ribosomal protein S18 acetylase RimI-like enzyme